MAIVVLSCICGSLFHVSQTLLYNYYYFCSCKTAVYLFLEIASFNNKALFCVSFFPPMLLESIFHDPLSFLSFYDPLSWSTSLILFLDPLSWSSSFAWFLRKYDWLLSSFIHAFFSFDFVILCSFCFFFFFSLLNSFMTFKPTNFLSALFPPLKSFFYLLYWHSFVLH